MAVGLGVLAIILIGIGIVALIRRLRHNNDVHSSLENGDSETSSSHQQIQKTMRANRSNLPSLKDCFPSSKGTHARNLKKTKPGRRNQTLHLAEEMEHKKHGGIMDNPLHKNHAQKWDASAYTMGNDAGEKGWDADKYTMGNGKPNEWSSEYGSAGVHKARSQTTLFSIPMQGPETSEGTSGYVTVATQNNTYDEPRAPAPRSVNSNC